MPDPLDPLRREHRLTACAALLAATLCGCVVPHRFDGPIPVRNQHPAQLTALRLEPVGVATVPAATGRAELGLSYSSLFVNRAAQGNRFVMDGEILRAGLRGRYGIADGVEVQVELPVAYTTGGFLDGFIEGWHEALGLPNAGREQRPRDVWEVRAEYEGAVAYEMEQDDFAMLDVPIGARWHFLRAAHSQPVDVAVRAGVELPTGDEDAGYGNGGFDYALGLVAGIDFGRAQLTAHVEHSFVHTPDRAAAAGVHYEDVTGGGVALEAPLTKAWTVIAQIEFENTVLRQIEGVKLDEEQTMLWLGCRGWLRDDLALDFSFGEDLSTNGSPDFTLYVGFRLDI